MPGTLLLIWQYFWVKGRNTSLYFSWVAFHYHTYISFPKEQIPESYILFAAVLYFFFHVSQAHGQAPRDARPGDPSLLCEANHMKPQSTRDQEVRVGSCKKGRNKCVRHSTQMLIFLSYRFDLTTLNGARWLNLILYCSEEKRLIADAIHTSKV